MKLLTPQQVQNIKQSEQIRDILRTKETDAAAERSRKALAQAEANFNGTLARQRHIWATEEEEHTKDIKIRQKEVDELETRKAKALIPIELYKAQADSYMAEAKHIFEQAKKREDDAEELSEKLQDKLDELGSREQDIVLAERDLVLKQAGLDRQALDIVSSNRLLNREIMNFATVRTKAEQDIHERKTALTLWERTLISKENNLKRTEVGLNSLAKKLEDDRATLDRAFKRLSPLK